MRVHTRVCKQKAVGEPVALCCRGEDPGGRQSSSNPGQAAAAAPTKTRASQSPRAGSPALPVVGQPSSSCPAIYIGNFTRLGADQLRGGQLQCSSPYLILPTPRPGVNGWQRIPGNSAFYSGGEAIPPWQPWQQPLAGPITPTRAAPAAAGGCQLPGEMLRRASLAGASPILQTRVVPHVRTAANDTANYPGTTEGLLIR